jgi:YVTN family beta-propeller protein
MLPGIREFRMAGFGLLLLPILFVKTTAQAPPPAYANFEGAQTNPIRLSPDGTRLFAVNTANASLSVFDLRLPARPALLAEIPVGLEPVSVAALTNDEAWVVNQESDSVSVVSVSKQIVTDTIYLKDEPMDVVFAGLNQAFVSVSRSNAIAVIDTNTHAVKKMIPVFGGNPRALAVSQDRSRVFAAFAMSGNGTTLVQPRFAPPPPPPTNASLPPAPQTALIIKASDPSWSTRVPYKMPDYDVVIIDTGAALAVRSYISGTGTINLGIAVQPKTGDLWVANTEALNLTRFEPNLKGHFVENRITRVQLASRTVTPYLLNPDCAVTPGQFCIDYSTLPNPHNLAVALAQPAGVVFDPAGASMYVAAFGTDRIAVVDTNGTVLSFIELAPASAAGSNVDPRNKRGPRGLAIRADGQTLYVLNRISNTITVVNGVSKSVFDEIPVGADRTPAAVRNGRGFLYDAKLSGTGNASCAACHVDGDTDHLAWDLGDPGGNLTTMIQAGTTITFHPMKGPMNTQTLRGLNNQSPYHWRGEKAQLSSFNPAFASLMGGTPLSDPDMQAFGDFINTILFQPNPNQNLDRTMPAVVSGGDPNAGRSTFINAVQTKVISGTFTCNHCHAITPGFGSNRLIDPVNFKPQPLKIPPLRTVYQRQLYCFGCSSTIDGFGLDHDGRSAMLGNFFGGGAFAAYTATQKQDLSAFLLTFDTGTAPAVGYARTVTPSNVGNSSVQSDWALLQAQAAAGNIDLIARGTVNGELHGLTYTPSTASYTDDTGSGIYTQAQLQAVIQGGDTLSFMGVYPGTGTSH